MTNAAMNQAKGNWQQVKGKIKETWGKLTDDEITQLEGNAQQFYGKVQEKYGIAQAEAEKKINEWKASCGCSSSDSSCSTKSGNQNAA